MKSSKKRRMAAWILMLLAVAYDVSPVDVIPDVLPVVGWMDDVVVTGLALFNLFRQRRQKKEA